MKPKRKPRYCQVTVKPYRLRKYPLRATEIVFTLPRTNAVQAVETLMCHMGYKCSQYRFVSSEETSERGLK